MKRGFIVMKKTWHPAEVTLSNLNNSISIVNNDFNYTTEDLINLGLKALKQMRKDEDNFKKNSD